MATPDLEALVSAAQNFNVPPQILRGIALRDQAAKGDHRDAIWATTVARTLRGVFDKTQDWAKALSVYRTGDENVADSPTNPAAGWVAAVLGIAGSDPVYGMRGFKPTDGETWAATGDAFKSSLSDLVGLGGVVTAEGVDALDKHLKATAPTQAKEPVAAPADHPDPQQFHVQQHGPDFKKVAEFVEKAMGLGIDPEHFSEMYGHASQIGRRLLGKAPTLEDFSQMVGMNQTQILQHLSLQPHPVYPEITAGQYHQAMHKATLFAGQIGRMPYPSEALRFASTSATDSTIEKYYGINQQPQPTKQAAQTQQPKQQQGQ